MRVFKELRQKAEKISELESEIERLKDENAVLWMQLDEIKSQEQAIFEQMKEELNEVLLRNIEPIGNA
jgi:prefoldin subunit 5